MNNKQLVEFAYNFWKNGRIAQIWKVRRECDLERSEFDNMIMDLVKKYEIQLVGGDPSIMTKDQIEDSMKVGNTLYLGIIFR